MHIDGNQLHKHRVVIACYMERNGGRSTGLKLIHGTGRKNVGSWMMLVKFLVTSNFFAALSYVSTLDDSNQLRFFDSGPWARFEGHIYCIVSVRNGQMLL